MRLQVTQMPFAHRVRAIAGILEELGDVEEYSVPAAEQTIDEALLLRRSEEIRVAVIGLNRRHSVGRGGQRLHRVMNGEPCVD